jgi:methyltransferase (TIGR00027 family)
MRSDRPSDTATWIALARALSDRHGRVRGFSDPLARQLLPHELVSGIAPRAVLARLLGRALERIVALRTVAIDEALRAAVAPQLVVLGAGLDARAWRLPELGSTVAFEVDHPATQAYKRSRVAGMKPLARDVRFVPVDFERDSLDARLAEAGHDASARTFWIWEGVISYLHVEAMRATLRMVSARSAPGSRLAALYLPRRFGDILTAAVTSLVGEPHRAHYAPEEMAAELARAGLRLVVDTSLRDWGERFESAPTWPFGYFGGSHMAVAEKP